MNIMRRPNLHHIALLLRPPDALLNMHILPRVEAVERAEAFREEEEPHVSPNVRPGAVRSFARRSDEGAGVVMVELAEFLEREGAIDALEDRFRWEGDVNRKCSLFGGQEGRSAYFRRDPSGKLDDSACE